MKISLDNLWTSKDVESLMQKYASFPGLIDKINLLIEKLQQEFDILSQSISLTFPTESEEGEIVRTSANRIVSLNNELINLLVEELTSKIKKDELKTAETDSVVVKKVEKQEDTERARKKIPAVRVPVREP